MSTTPGGHGKDGEVNAKARSRRDATGKGQPRNNRKTQQGRGRTQQTGEGRAVAEAGGEEATTNKRKMVQIACAAPGSLPGEPGAAGLAGSSADFAHLTAPLGRDVKERSR